MPSSFRRAVLLKHLSPGQYVEGNWIEGQYTESTIYASVQPAGNNDMQSLPQGRRENKAYVLYTETKLESVDKDNPDILVIYDEEYEVTRVEAWQNTDLAHYRCLVTRKSV